MPIDVFHDYHHSRTTPLFRKSRVRGIGYPLATAIVDGVRAGNVKSRGV
jgi:hypothetical protein